MNRSTMKRLERLEASASPEGGRNCHLLFDDGSAEYETRRAALEASGAFDRDTVIVISWVSPDEEPAR